MSHAADVLVIGAGAAGIAAARSVMAGGRTALLIEARDRLGGRAVTQAFDGYPVDLGAHWIHAARINPLVPVARETGHSLSRARYAFTTFRDGRTLGLASAWALDAAWEKAENRIFEAADRIDRQGGDVSIREAIGNVGPWTDAVTFMHANYDCGAAAELLSTVDFARVDDEKDLLVAGGLGALITGLARELPVRLASEVVAIRHEGGGVAVTLRDGAVLSGRAAIITVPLMVLASGTIRFEPALPSLLADVFAGFHAAAYEHVLLRSANPPWGRKANRIVLSMTEGEHIVLFGAMDGTNLHYLDMVGDAGRALAALPEAERAQAAVDILKRHFGSDVPARVEVLHVTSWSADPYARAGWALARLGAAPLRARLRDPYGALFFAGEAASQGQWGTVGGAWGEGERAARQALDLIGTAPVA